MNIFGGEADSAYYMAKHIIHLIDRRSESDQQQSADWQSSESRLIPNYSVSLAHDDSSSDLAEQISLAGTKLPAPVT
ncbi:glycogen/starch/alpha-glucan phosphorylase [Shigella flexneri]